MRLGVVIPSGDMVHATMAMSLGKMLVKTAAAGVQCALINPKSSLVPVGRVSGAMSARQLGCNAVLFIDSDMLFPPDLALQLINRIEKGAGQNIIGCAVPKRKPPFTLNVQSLSGTEFEIAPDETGLVEVRSVGAGIMLVPMQVFEKILQPWFPLSWSDDGLLESSEDQNFCNKARLAGYQVLVDCDLSKRVGHIGTYVYTIPEVMEYPGEFTEYFPDA